MAKKKVGLVELPDEAMDVFNHFTQSKEWTAFVLVNTAPESSVKRMARILGITIHEMPSMDYLGQCEIVIIGDESCNHFSPIREMLAGTGVELVMLKDIRDRIASGGPLKLADAIGETAEPPDELDAAFDAALDNALFGNTAEPTDTPVKTEPEADAEPATETPAEVPVQSIDDLLDGLVPEQPVESTLEPIAFVGTEPEGAADHETSREPENIESVEVYEEPETPEPPEPVEAEEFEEIEEFEEAEVDEAEEEAPVYDLSEAMADVTEGEMLESEAMEERFEETAEEAPEEATEEAPENSPEETPAHEFVLEPADDFAADAFVVEDDEVVEVWAEGSQAPVEAIEEAKELETPEVAKELDSAQKVGDEPATFASDFQDGTPDPFSAEPVLAEPADVQVEEFQEEVVVAESPEAEPEFEPAIPSSVEEDETPSEFPEPTIDARTGFDLSVLLGPELSRWIGTVQIDSESRELRGLMTSILEATGAQTGSIMLPEVGGEHLRIAVAVGLSDEIITRSRPVVGEGLVGTAFATGEPQASQADVPDLAETGGSQQYRLSASVPIQKDSRTFGVLTVNVESSEPVSKDELLATMTPFVTLLQIPILEAVDLSLLDMETKQNVLTRHIDRIMAQDIMFTDRLTGMAEVIRSAIKADHAYLYEVDAIHGRLELASSTIGEGQAGGLSQSLDSGLMSWMVRRGGARLVTISDPDAREDRGMAYLTINTSRPFGLVVLENFPVAPRDKDILEKMLGMVVEQVEDIFEVERGVETQDILSQIRLRVTDRAARLDYLPPELRTQPALELAIQELNGEVAIWIPGPGEKPVIAQPQSRQAAKILADVFDGLSDIRAWIREKEIGASGATGPGWDAAGPEGPAPYVGVKDPEGEGVLIAFLTPDQEGKALPRLPIRVLSEVLIGICKLIRTDSDASASVAAEVPIQENDDLLDGPELDLRIQEELNKTPANGIPTFAVTRFTLEGGFQDLDFLRHFLLTNKRTVDTIAEFIDGSFVLLSPDTDPNSEGVGQRFVELWKSHGSELELRIEKYDGKRGAAPLEDAA